MEVWSTNPRPEVARRGGQPNTMDTMSTPVSILLRKTMHRISRWILASFEQWRYVLLALLCAARLLRQESFTVGEGLPLRKALRTALDWSSKT